MKIGLELSRSESLGHPQGIECSWCMLGIEREGPASCMSFSVSERTATFFSENKEDVCVYVRRVRITAQHSDVRLSLEM